MMVEVSFDRWHSRFICIMSTLVILFSVTPSVRADDTWHNIYHSLKRFFTGDSSSNRSPHHRAKRATAHEKTDRSTEPVSTAAEGSPRPAASPAPRLVVLPAASPAAESNQATSSSSPAKEA